jgi:hypothetical protein
MQLDHAFISEAAEAAQFLPWEYPIGAIAAAEPVSLEPQLTR